MNPVHFSAESQVWRTPMHVFAPLHAAYGFTVDVCALPENAMLTRYFTPETDGLAQPWHGERVWCNPPYGRGMERWIAKLASGAAELAVGFIPARTDTRWFHDHVLGKAQITFLKGRVKFEGAPYNAPFPSMICVWRRG